MRIFSKEKEYFELFDKVAANISHAATTLIASMEHFTNLDNWANEIHDIEEAGDLLTHDIIRKMNKSLGTPIDREDIHTLALTLDDIIDFIWGTADRIALYKMNEPPKETHTMSKTLLTMVELVHKAIKELKAKNYSQMHKYCVQINKLENEMDRTFRDALGHLFNEIKDPVTIIKWKDIYEHLENASDKCEDVAEILDTIASKDT